MTAWPRPTSGPSTIHHPATTEGLRIQILPPTHPRQPLLQNLRPRALHRSRPSTSPPDLPPHDQASLSPNQTFPRSQHLHLLHRSSLQPRRLPKQKPKLPSLPIPRANRRTRALTTESRHRRTLRGLVRSTRSRTLWLPPVGLRVSLRRCNRAAEGRSIPWQVRGHREADYREGLASVD